MLCSKSGRLSCFLEKCILVLGLFGHLASAKSLSWNATVIDTPKILTDRLFDLSLTTYATLFAADERCEQISLSKYTCFEAMRTNRFHVTNAAIKEGFRRASKIYHPDKGGDIKDFLLPKACHSYLQRTDIKRWWYLMNVQLLETKRMWWGEHRFRDGIEKLNEELLIVKVQIAVPKPQNTQVINHALEIAIACAFGEIFRKVVGPPKFEKVVDPPLH